MSARGSSTYTIGEPSGGAGRSIRGGMSLPKLFVTAALGAALLPATAQAAAPWSDPVTVPGSSGQAGGAPQVLSVSYTHLTLPTICSV